MNETTKLQQEAIYELLATEVSYIRQILTMTDVFMTSVKILKSSERDGIFNDIDMEKLFSNIQDVIEGNLLFWKTILLPIRQKLQSTGTVMNPSDFKHGFLQVDSLFSLCSALLSIDRTRLVSVRNVFPIVSAIRSRSKGQCRIFQTAMRS